MTNRLQKNGRSPYSSCKSKRTIQRRSMNRILYYPLQENRSKQMQTLSLLYSCSRAYKRRLLYSRSDYIEDGKDEEFLKLKNMYTPYSLRHNITDPDLAGLLDYLEREMGWDITINFYHWRKYFAITSSYDERMLLATEMDYPAVWNEIFLRMRTPKDMRYIWGSYFYPIEKMSKDLFFRTYKTILPEIRNLYSK